MLANALILKIQQSFNQEGYGRRSPIVPVWRDRRTRIGPAFRVPHIPKNKLSTSVVPRRALRNELATWMREPGDQAGLAVRLQLMGYSSLAAGRRMSNR